jgi:hypothetical protein
MSSLYTQISQAAAEQKQQVEQSANAEKTADEATPVNEAKQSTDSQQDRTVTPNDRTDDPNGSPVGSNEAPADDAEHAIGWSQHSHPANGQAASLIDEMENGVDDDVRPTERYSFEIYTDQKEKIVEIKYRYEKRTGKRLPKSRIIREALDHYFEQVLDN